MTSYARYATVATLVILVAAAAIIAYASYTSPAVPSGSPTVTVTAGASDSAIMQSAGPQTVAIIPTGAAYDAPDDQSGQSYYFLNVTIANRGTTSFPPNGTSYSPEWGDFEVLNSSGSAFQQVGELGGIHVIRFNFLSNVLTDGYGQPVALGAGENVSGSLFFSIPTVTSITELRYVSPALNITVSSLPTPRWLSLIAVTPQIMGDASDCASFGNGVMPYFPPSYYLLSGTSITVNVPITIYDFEGCIPYVGNPPPQVGVNITLPALQPQQIVEQASVNPSAVGEVASPVLPLTIPSGCIAIVISNNSGSYTSNYPGSSCDTPVSLSVTAPAYSAIIDLNVTLTFQYDQG